MRARQALYHRAAALAWPTSLGQSSSGINKLTKAMGHPEHRPPLISQNYTEYLPTTFHLPAQGKLS